MKSYVCIALLVACAMAAPTPEEGQRDKRSYTGLGYTGLGYTGLGYIGHSAHSLAAPLISHAPLVYSGPAAVIHEPAIVSVKRIVSVPQVVSVKKIVSYPHVARVAHYVSAPRVSYSYAPSYSAGWW